MITESNANVEFPSMTYFSGDMTRKDTGLSSDELLKVRSANVVSFVKFFSTVSAFIKKDSSRGNLLRVIFRKLKPGALVFYVDNCHGKRHTEFKSVASSEGVTDVLYDRCEQIRLPGTKRSAILKRFDEKTKSTIRKCFRVSIMLLRKPIIVHVPGSRVGLRAPSVSTLTTQSQYQN